jgi:hypothetical protein
VKLPIVGPTYVMDNKSFDVQRCINLYPMVSETGTSKEQSSLRGTPGLREYVDTDGGPIRGEISTASGRAFAVSGSILKEITGPATSVTRGTLDTATSRCFIAENGTQIMIVDGLYGYTFNMDTDTFAKITDPQFIVPTSVTFQDGYFIVTRADTQEYYISAINDGTSWAADDFGTAEYGPDDLLVCLSDASNLWLGGSRTIEVHQNTGAAAFPFERIPGAVIPTGVAAAATFVRFDNTVAWLGTDEFGRGVVWRADGYNAVKFSTQAIEKRIAEAEDFTESYAYVYHEQGHVFFNLQVKGLDTTLVYDGTVGQWHERSYANSLLGTREQHRGSCHMFFDGKNLIGDRENGKIYEQALNIYSDDGQEIIRERIIPHIQDEKRRITHSALELDMEVGNGGQIMMQMSDDGGYTWSNEQWRSLGEVGEYNTRVIWRRLGAPRDRVYKFMISDDVPVQINGAYLNAA